MPLRQYGKAKAHVFLDVDMEEVARPVPRHELHAGWGTKVVITIGPSCQDVATLAKLLQAGVTCARVDLSWGTRDYHARSLHNLAEAMKQTKLLCSVWLDTVGREMVVRRPIDYDPSGWPRHLDNKIVVDKDKVFKITTDPTAVASATTFPVNYPGFPAIVDVGQQVQIGRYLATGSEGYSLFADVVDVGEDEVACVAANSAVLDGLLSVMLCHNEDEDFRSDFGLPLLTGHDVDCIRNLGSQFEVDFLSLSFCNSADDLYSARALLDSLGMQQTKIIAKIERKAAIRNFEAIAHVADGIVISRGNLGLDFEPEVMALLQKRIISRCNQLGKPVHLTRIVDTMVSSPRPTRAEATDVANAVLDGVDGVMLGAETLRGAYPVQTVEMVVRLAAAAEQHFDYRTHHEQLMGEAFEEEVSLKREDVSVSDFNLYQSSSPDTTLHRHRARSIKGSLRSTGSEEHAADGDTTAAGLSGPAAMQGIGNGPSTGAVLAGAGSPRAPQAQPDGVPNGGATTAAPGGGVVQLASPAQPYLSSFGSLPPNFVAGSAQLRRALLNHAPYMSKLESVASSATRTAEKINAGLIMVMVQTGRTVSLVSKYRPPMPIMAVVVPTLKSTSLGWQLEGKYLARQTLALRGVVPMMAAPLADAAGSDDLLSEAVHAAYLQRLVQPMQYVVCIMSHRGSLLVKVVQVDRSGTGLRSMGGLNSALIGSEPPDIISSRSPFGAFMPPPSPRAGPTLAHSPGRTLSGRPSMVVPSSPNAFSLGGGGGAAGAARNQGGYNMISTPSEFEPYDMSMSRLATELATGRPGRAERAEVDGRTRTSSPLGSSPGGSPTGPRDSGPPNRPSTGVSSGQRAAT